MNLDIVSIPDERDMVLAVSDVPKAANVLSVQLGSLEYAKDFGVDFRFFLDDGLQFQNESFRSYLVERLTRHQINVVDVASEIDRLFENITLSVGDSASDAKGLIR
jgi:hypothetical protein